MCLPFFMNIYVYIYNFQTKRNSNTMLTDRYFSCGIWTFRRGVYAMCDAWILHGTMAGTVVRYIQYIFYVYFTINHFNYHVRFNGDYDIK